MASRVSPTQAVISQVTRRGCPRAMIVFLRLFFFFWLLVFYCVFCVCVCVFFLVGFLVCGRVCLSLGVFEGEERSQELVMEVELSVMDAVTPSARDASRRLQCPGPVLVLISC